MVEHVQGESYFVIEDRTFLSLFLRRTSNSSLTKQKGRDSCKFFSRMSLLSSTTDSRITSTHAGQTMSIDAARTTPKNAGRTVVPSRPPFLRMMRAACTHEFTTTLDTPMCPGASRAPGTIGGAAPPNLRLLASHPLWLALTCMTPALNISLTRHLIPVLPRHQRPHPHRSTHSSSGITISRNISPIRITLLSLHHMDMAPATGLSMVLRLPLALPLTLRLAHMPHALSPHIRSPNLNLSSQCQRCTTHKRCTEHCITTTAKDLSESM